MDLTQKSSRLFHTIGDRTAFFVAIVLLLMTLIAYGSSLHNEFIIDDIGFANGEFTQFYHHFGEFFTKIPPLSQHYIPFYYIANVFLFKISQNNAFNVRLIILFLFFFNCILFYRISYLISNNARIAFVTSLLFCVHPIHGSSLYHVSANIVFFSALFMQMSFITYWEYLSDKKRKGAYCFLSLFFVTLSLLSFEVSTFFPVFMGICLYFVKKYTIRETIMNCFPFILFSVFFFVLWLFMTTPSVNFFKKISLFQINLGTYLATYSQLVLWYIGNLFYPISIVPIKSIVVGEQVNYVPLILLCCSLFVIYFLILKFWKKSVRSLAVLWFSVGLLMLFPAIFAHSDMGLLIEPHWLYFSSFGFFLLAAVLIETVYRKFNIWVWGVTLLFLTGYLLGHTLRYNQLAKSAKAYYQYWLTITPDNHAPNFWLATEYMNEGNYKMAQEYFHNSWTHGYDDWKLYSNLGLIAFRQGKDQEALQHFHDALKINPRSALVYNNIGTIYLAQNQLTLAKENYWKAIAINSYLIEPRLNIAQIHESQGQMEEARKLYAENLSLNPQEIHSLAFFVKYYLLSDREQALRMARRILNLRDVNNALLLTNVGSLLARNNLLTDAHQFYLKALEIDAHEKLTLIELGKFHGNQEEWDVAISYWQRGLNIDPNDQVLKDLILRAETLRAHIGIANENITGK